MLDITNVSVFILILLSTVVQFAVAVLAYRITTKTSFCRPAWITITIALILMVIRRLGVSYEIMTDTHHIEYYAWPEVLGLILSVCLFKGFYELDKCFVHEINHLTSLAEEIPAIVCIHNKDGYFYHFNNKWQEYTGIQKSESRGNQWKALIHPDDLAAFSEYFDMCVKASCLFEAKIRLKGKDGEYRWHFMRSMPVKDKRGRTDVWFTVISDIDDYVLRRKFFYGRE